MPTQPRNRRQAFLPHSLQPIGLSRDVAAAFIDVSPTYFDEMVRDGRMPKPKQIDARQVWSRLDIEQAFAALPTEGETQDGEECSRNSVADTPEERARTQLTRWEKKLLFSLYRAGGCADPSTIEGSGPTTRETLAKRGLLLDEGNTLQLTEEGTILAKSKGAVTHKRAPLNQA